MKWVPIAIPYICVVATVNMAGGQPISMANMRQVHALAQQHGIRVFLDATRCVENAYFIQQREEGYRHAESVASILQEFCSYSDGCTMSGKKDALVNIGGWLAMNDATLYEQASNLVVVYEGLHTYGGMAGRDMEAMARGIVESVQDDHIRARVGQVEYLGQKLMDWGIPVVSRSAATPSIWMPNNSIRTFRSDEFPAQMLAAELYHRFGRPDHGAGHRLGRSRSRDGRSSLPGSRTGPSDHPTSRLHAGPHGRRGGDRRRGLGGTTTGAAD